MHLCKSNSQFDAELGTSGSTRSVQNDTTNLGSNFSLLLRMVETSCNWNSYGWRQLHLLDSADERWRVQEEFSQVFGQKRRGSPGVQGKDYLQDIPTQIGSLNLPVKERTFLLLLASCMSFKLTFEDTYLTHLLERHRLGITWLSLSWQKRKD